MAKILVIDDERIYHKMITHAIRDQNHEVFTAMDGQEGLKVASEKNPDLIITDVMMPNLSGYELTRKIRRNPKFAHTPILVLTTQSELDDKLKAFEAGADDHMSKPFEPAELNARIRVLLKRGELAKRVEESPRKTTSRIIAVHSLRGGIGCSSLAVNLAVGFSGLWGLPTILLDMALIAGQVALMLNSSLKRTWADISRFGADDLEFDILRSIIGQHESGLHFIASPTFPSEAEFVSEDLLGATIEMLSGYYEYIVADLAHDFSDATLRTLDAADVILLVLAPEIASIRAAAAAIDTYKKFNYPESKIKLVLNWTFTEKGLPRKNIETALHLPVDVILPHSSSNFIEAINFGKPLLSSKPEDPTAIKIENLAFKLSKEAHRKKKPKSPTPAYRRILNRFGN